MATYNGTNGDDVINATSGGNTINAGNGNNRVTAMGSGTQKVTAGTGNDTITTGEGSDNIKAGAGNNVINAGGGHNDVTTLGGNDTITTGSGNDDISAGDGRNVINAGEGENSVTSGSGDDDIRTGAGDDEISAGDGNNVINAGGGGNEITAGAGNDTITTGSGNDRISAGNGNNVVDAGGGHNAVYTGSGNDQITTGSGNDAIYAGDGNNVINAGDGFNAIYSGSGNDRIITGSGTDLVYSGAGDDFVDLGGGSDLVYLDGGNDTYRYVMSQNTNAIDVAWGGSGTDTLQLVLTADQARDARVISDIQRFNTDSGGDGLWGWIFGFRFTAFNLSIRDFENIDVIAPVDAVNDAATVNEDSQVTVNVLANDLDLGEANNSQLRVTGYDAAGVPGTLTLANNQFTFVPGAAYQSLAAGQSTTVTFSYTIADNEGYTDTATVTLTITGSNDGPIAVADVAAITENQPLTIDVLANETDVDANHVFTLVSAGAPSGKGSATVVNNQLAFNPGTAFDHLAAGATETVVVTYTMQDDQGATSTSTLTVTVTGTNDGPIAVADAAAGAENQSLTVDVLANDTDLDDGHVFTLTSASAPGGKGVATVADNQLVFTPGTDFDHLAAGATEVVTLTYAMRDDQGAESVSTVTVTITGTNDGPVATADTAATTENDAITINVLANDTDLDDGAVFTLTGASSPAGKGAASIVANQLVFTPGTDFDHLAAGDTEIVTLSYVMQDDRGAESVSTVTVTITGTNDGPVAMADAGATTENAAVTVDVLANDTDLDDGHVFTLTAANAPSGKGAASIVANQLVFTPGTDFDHLAAGAIEVITLSYEMQDEHGATSTSTVTVTITGTNDAPVAIADVAAAIEDGAIVTGSVATNDSDVDDNATRSFALDAPITGLTLNADGSYGFDASDSAYQALAAGERLDVVAHYTITDEHGATAQATLTLTLTGTNDAPVVTSSVGDAAGAVREAGLDDAGTPSVAGQLASSDIDHDATATWSGSADGVYGSFAVDAAGAWAYTLDNSRTATDALAVGETVTETFTATVTDEHGATATQLVTITVTGTNDAPVAVADIAAGTENQILTIDVLANDADVDHGASFTLVSATAPADKGVASVVSNRLVFTPGTNFDHLAAGAIEIVTLSYTMKDDQGAESVSSVTVTITGTNDGPIAVADTGATTENAAITVDVLANDTDLDDGHVFTLTGAAAPAGKGIASVEGNQLVFTPGTDFDHLAAGATEVVTVSYTMQDDQGAESVSTLTITITGTNDAPVAVADTAAGTENQVLTVDVLANDTDLDDGHVFTLTAAAAPSGKGAASVVNNQLVFTPGADFKHLAFGATEVVVLSYTVEDDQGATSTSTVTVTITGTNDGPVAVADVAATDENAAITIDVLANDTDIDDGHVFTLVSASAPAAKGVASIAGNQLVFTPGTDFDHLAAGATEVVTVSYAMQDDQGAESVSTLTITITGTNDAPIAVADIAAGTENQTLTVDVLANDTDADDGHVFTLTGVSAPPGKGGVSILNNQLVFTPGTDFDHLAAGATEVITLSYEMQDDQGAISTSTVTVTITGTNDAPVAVADVATATEDGAIVTGTVAANDSDVDDGATRTFALNAPVAGLTLGADGSYSFDASNAAYQNLAQGATRVVTASYTATDDLGATAVSTLTFTVTGTNDAPVAVAGTASVFEDSIVSGNLGANDTDIDTGAVLTYALDAPVAGLTVNPNGTYSFSAANTAYQALAQGETQVVTAGYTVTDQFGATSQSNLSITVTGRNDTPVAVADTATATEDTIVTGNVGTNDSDVDHNAVLTYAATSTVAGLTINSDGSYSFDASNAAYQDLAYGATRVVTGTYRVTDQFGANTTSSLSVTVTGVNDAPTILSSTVNASPRVLLIDDDRGLSGTSTWQSTLTALGYTYATEVISSEGNPTSNLANYDIVIWSVGDQAYSNLTAQNVATLTAYLSGGGNLLYAGGHSVYQENNAQAFIQNQLGLTFYQYNMPTFSNGSQPIYATDATGAQIRLNVWAGGQYDNMLSGFQAGAPTARALLELNSGNWSGDAAHNDVAVINDKGTYRAATWGFDLNHIDATQRGIVLDATLKALSGSTGTGGASITERNDGAADENTATHSTTGTIAYADVDVGDIHSASFVGSVGYLGTFGLGTVDQTGNKVGWTFSVPDSAIDSLAAGQVVTQSYTVTVTDNRGASVNQVVTVTLTGTNDAPVVSGAVTGAAIEDGAAVTLNALANASDVDQGTTLSVVSVGTLPAGVTYDAAAKTFTLDPSHAAYQSLAQGQTQTVTVSYSVTDGLVAKPATAQWTVTGQNDAPVAVADTNAATEDTTVTGSVAANDSDVDSSALTYSLDAPVAGLTLNSDGTYSFNAGNAAYQYLAEGQTSVILANYTVTDPTGATATSTLSITVTGASDGPVANADTNAVAEDATVSGSVATNDVGASGTTLTYALNAPVAGLTLNTSGSYSFDAANAAYQSLAQGQTQVVVANYTVTDNTGLSATSTLSITVTGTNDRPTVAADTASATEDGAVVNGSVAANDSDPDAGAVVTYTLDAPVAGLTLNSNGTYSFSPSNSAYQALAAGATQAVAANYTATDQFGATSTSTLTITVTGTNDAPTVAVAYAPALPTTEQVASSLKGAITVGDVDTGAIVTTTLSVGYGVLNAAVGGSGATIVSGNGTATLVVRGTVAQLTALLNTDGTSTLSYTPNTDTPPASTTLTVTVNDGTASSSANQVIAITAINDAPAGADRTLTATEDTALTLTTANFAFTDADGNGLASVKITTVPAAGSLTLNGVAVTADQVVSAADIAAGKLVFTPAANANGAGYANFTFQVQDNGGTANGGADTDQSPNTMTINVTAVNDAVTDVSLSATSAPENVPSTVVGVLSATDADATDTFTYSIRPGLDGSLFTIVGNELRVGGTGLDYEQAGTRQVTVRVTDAAGTFFDRTFTIQVLDSNEFTLTTANDTFTSGATNDQVLANSLTLNPGDRITTGGGADELLLFGQGSFNLGSLTAYSGVETVRLINLTTGTATLTLKAGVQNDVIASGTGATAVTLNDLASTVTLSDGADTVTLGTGAATVSTGSGNDIVHHFGGAATINTGAFNDTIYLGNGLAAVNAGADQDAIYVDQNGFNAAQQIDGGQGSDTLYVNGTRDLTAMALTNLESLYVSGAATLSAAQLAQFSNFNGTAAGKVTVADATLDLTGKSVTNINFYSTNATGTLFKVSSAAAALQMFGGNGNDTVQVVGAALTADQRDILFAVSSIETLIDSSGTYSAPAATPGLIRLTTGADTLPASPDSLTVNATASTLTTNDTLDAGATGSDVLAMYGTGTFNMNSYNVSGFEEFRLINNTTTAVNFTMKSGQSGLVNATGTGNSTIQLSSGATTVTTGTGNDTVYGSSGAATISTGAGSDTIFGGSGLMNIDAGDGNDTVYVDYYGWNAASSFNGGLGYDYLYLYQGARDLSTATLTNFEYLYVSGDTKMTAAQVAQFQQFQGGGVRINVADAALDLSGKSVGNVMFGSLNATGTTFKVNSTSVAFQVLGGSGNDTLDAATLTLTAAQRNAIFNGSLLETIIDATGTYSAPALPAGTVKLTTANDTLPALPDSLTVLANAFTLGAGDSLNAGATGTDTLALFGAGQFYLYSPAALTGFEAITLDNSTGGQATVYLRSGMAASFTSVGSGSVSLNTSDTAVTVTLGAGNDVVQFGSGSGTVVDTGGGSDTVYTGNAQVSINQGAGNDTIYDFYGWNNATTLNGGADFDMLYLSQSRDLTAMSVSNFEYLYLSGSLTVKTTGAQFAQFSQVQGSTGAKISTGDATLDLTGKSIGSGISFISENATGTTFKVSNSTQAFQIVGGAGQDMVENAGTALTSDQRTALLNGASVEVLLEGNIFHGGSGANSIVGNANANTIYGNAGNDTIDGGAGADSLYGGDGNDTFVFRAGQTNGDSILDFAGNGAGVGDSLTFYGFGAAADGANFVQLDATHWQVNSADGTLHETITVGAGTTFDPADITFDAGGSASLSVLSFNSLGSDSAGIGDQLLRVSVQGLFEDGSSANTGTAVGEPGEFGAGGLSSQALGRPSGVAASQIATADAETLQATAGDDVFVFHAGTADGDHVLDFQGLASQGADRIELVGFGPDAVFTSIDETHWRIDYNAGTQHEVITFDNATPINTQDFAFV